MATPSTLTINANGLTADFQSTTDSGTWATVAVDITKTLTILIDSGGLNERTRTVSVEANTVTKSVGDTVATVTFNLLNTGIHSGEDVEIVLAEAGILDDTVLESAAITATTAVTNSSTVTAVTSTITEYDSGETKWVGFGCLSFSSRSSGLGFGERAEHLDTWEITGPVGWTQIITNKTEGNDFGKTFDFGTDLVIGPRNIAIYADVAGIYTVKHNHYDNKFLVATSTVNTTVVAEDVTFDNIYCRLDASGSNNGTSDTDAYTNFQTALNDWDSKGDNATLWVAGGQSGSTYDPTTAITPGTDSSNIRIMGYNRGTQDPIIDIATANALGWAGKRHTQMGLSWTNTSGGVSNGNMANFSVFSSDGTRHIAVDIAIIENTALAGNNMENLVAETWNGDTRMLLMRNDTTVGMYAYTLFFGSPDLLFSCGNDVGSSDVGSGTDGERPVRITTGRVPDPLDVSIDSTNVGVSFFKDSMDNDHKNCIRYVGGIGCDIIDCYLACSASQTIWWNDNSGAPGGVPEQLRILGNQIINTGDSTCIKMDIDNTMTSEGVIVISGNLIQHLNLASSAGPVNLNNGGNAGGFADRVIFVGNTIQGHSSTANANQINISATTELVCSNNILNYLGTTTVSQFNDMMASIDSTATSISVRDNIWAGTDQIQEPNDRLKIDGTRRTIVELNANSWASGNIEEGAVATFDSDFLPTSSYTVTVPTIETQHVDYYLTRYTEIGQDSSIGMVTALVIIVTPPIDDEPSGSTRTINPFLSPSAIKSPSHTIKGISYPTRRSGHDIEEMPLELPIAKPVTIVLEETDSNHEVRYTTNGKNPTSKSKLYSGPLVLTRNLTGSDNTIIKSRIYNKLNPNIHSRITKIRIRVV